MKYHEELTQAVETALNRSPTKLAEELTEMLTHTHPSLQQTWWLVVRKIAEKYSVDLKYTDARNTQAKRLAEEIARIAKEQGLCFWII